MWWLTYNDNTCTSGRCTSFKTPDDGRLRAKHVEWPCRNKTCTVLHQVGVSFDFVTLLEYVTTCAICVPVALYRCQCTRKLRPCRWTRGRSRWPRGLRRRSAAARLLRLWVRIPPGAWIFVCCECFVLSGRGLCDELITRPEESYRLWCVVVCDLETSWMRRPWTTGGCRAKNKQTLTHVR